MAEQARGLADLQEKQHQAAAQALAQQQAWFNSMLEGLLLLDREGRVQLVNQALERMFGLKGDPRGQTVLEAFRLHQLPDLIDRVAREGQVLGFEIELPGLEKRCVEINAAAIRDREGRPHGMTLIFHDLTRLKQLENTRQEFVANVSHELRTPLTLIKGCVETLIDGAKDDPAVATRFLQTIQKHTDRLVYLIEDLLTISKLESGQIVLNLHAVPLRPITERVLDDLLARAAEKKVRILNEVPPGIVVRADSDRLQQVLFNLVENAIKYGQAEGVVTVGARRDDQPTVEIWVRDNGPGIPPEATERIFERFYRVDRARAREQGGTGLGLSIVKHIVQTHGGEVWVESKLGQGATFYFTLPGEK
ncbi:MAG: PAS domain-containing protein [Chloroflexi bacterium]|nr:PAS domain-containing protein [Chloroflexota bacterium]